ncbi:hypothetical protein RIF29_28552 [Crotalaria pallida]|uniref:Ribosomal protein L34Ae n=1 Tax=Crotalaria pallida TaxID=3830 RepID=A0AAN9EDB8_CROPI
MTPPPPPPPLFSSLFLCFLYYSPEAMNSVLSSSFPHENHETESNHSEPKTESFEDTELKPENFGALSDTFSCQSNQIEEEEEEEEETTKLVFKFQYQRWDCNIDDEQELKGSCDKSCDFLKRSDSVSSSARTNKYDFLENQVTNTTNYNENRLMLEKCVGGSVVNEEVLDDSTQRVLIDHFLSEDNFICPMANGFLSDTDFGTTIGPDTLGNRDEQKNAGLTEKDLDFADEKKSESLDDEEDVDIMEELQQLEQECMQQNPDLACKENSCESKPEEYAKCNSQSLTAFDHEDSNHFDTLWEHQDLVEQLKMELKKVRATGLPTILEDSESPWIMEDLQPWKIDDAKFQHGNELPKFYRSYRERMRKFDILNYQKMYAMGFLQSKDPQQSFSCRKNSSSTMKCNLPQSFRLGRLKNAEPDPKEQFIKELCSDLETVYVGQLCLSWEFLQWEYDKALKLWESDHYGLLRFNEVAGEFQQFQVLLQRFLENEPFQDPRVENYARNRCVMRNLLQVPVIREDNSKDKKEFRKREADQDIITSDMLVEILEESIRIIWRFIKADKDTSSLSLKSLRETKVELQNPADFELLVEIQTDLHKKEKRLRDLLRSRSCILKKFKKYDEDETDQALYFFSQFLKKPLSPPWCWSFELELLLNIFSAHLILA